MKKLLVLIFSVTLIAASCDKPAAVLPNPPVVSGVPETPPPAPVIAIQQSIVSPVVAAPVLVPKPVTAASPVPAPVFVPDPAPAPIAVDFCKNLSDNQTTVPDNMQRDDNSNCNLVSAADASVIMVNSLNNLADDLAQITRLKANIAYDDAQYTAWITEIELNQWRNFISDTDSNLNQLALEITNYKNNLYLIQQQVLQRNTLDPLVTANLTLAGIVTQQDSYQTKFSIYSLAYIQELAVVKSEDMKN